MIGFLRGVLAAKHPPVLWLDVAGVGYEIEAPMSTFYELPDVGDTVQLVTHLVVREDAHILYGFATEAERSLFRGLIKVSGVGPRIALAILSGISVEGFARCVRTEDSASLVKVPGIGKKTAERLIVEMRDRLGAGERLAGPASETVPGPAAAEDEAYGALVALGYRPPEAVKMLAKVDAGGLSSEDIIRAALQAAAK
jgi:Holliday junction DNA helicase RuvA